MIASGSKCALADKGCRGRLEWHHAIKQQRLRREFKHGAYSWLGKWRPLPRPALQSNVYPHLARLSLDDILGDPRNRIWLCSHHHELTTNGRLEVELPEPVWEFAREFGLVGALENDLARRVA